MTKPAAITGDYTDIRFIKSRKVAVINIEIPIEAAGAFVEAFGTPNPATGVPVAIARMVGPTVSPERKGGKLAQQAGIICQEPAFAKFIEEKYAELSPCDPAEFVRHKCIVHSRADLDHHESAGRRFKDLKLEYEAWLKVDA